MYHWSQARLSCQPAPCLKQSCASGVTGATGMANPPIDAPSLMDIVIPLLLFADDLALFSHSHAGLQAQLDILHAFCKDRGLEVNIAKTKVMVFEHRHTECDPFFYDGREISRVEAFKYLGIMFHETRGMSCAIEQLTASAQKALFAMYANCRRLHIMDPRLRCQLFDALVRPILTYACEIWMPIAGKAALEKLEQLHKGFLRSMLGLPSNVTSKLVYAEFARAPLKDHCWKQCMKYLERLHSMEDSRLCKLAYLTACRHNTAWRRGIEGRLQKLAIPPPPPHEEYDAKATIAASTDMYTEWMMQPDPDSNIQRTYYSIKQHHRMEPYIYEAKNAHMRKIVARFRCGLHWLQINVGRHRHIERQERFCLSCKHAIDDEMHALFSCPVYDNLRVKYNDLFEGPPDLHSFLCKNPVHRLALFLTECRAINMQQ